MRSRSVFLFTVLVSYFGFLPLNAQTAGAAPQTYSLREDPGFSFAGPVVVKISRDGAKEVIEQIMPAAPGRDKEFHSRLLYDFQAHKVYTQILSDPGSSCGLQSYKESAAPAELDPISGAAALMKELTADAQLKSLPGETVNGIATKVMAVTSDKASAKIWLAQEGGYPVKIAVMTPDGKETTFLEVKQLSLAKPAASDLLPPTGCEIVEVRDAIKPTVNVTSLTLQPIPAYNGACPARITMVGTITTDGPGTVFYQFGAGRMEPGETVTFSAAGSKTVSHAMSLQPVYGNNMGGSAILEAVGTDASGQHDLAMKGSNNSDFTINCTTGGGK
jgi:hypothetical protein